MTARYDILTVVDCIFLILICFTQRTSVVGALNVSFLPNWTSVCGCQGDKGIFKFYCSFMLWSEQNEGWLHVVVVSDEDELLIERSVHTGMINPGDQWQTIPHDGPVARLNYRIRVRCDENYYGNKCNKLCVPRDDYFGHYRCESSGAQVCLDGWMGPECRTGKHH